MPEHKLYCNGDDWVVATSEEDAAKIACDELYGITVSEGASHQEAVEDEGYEKFEEVTGEVTLRDEDGEETHDAADWCALKGRGPMASTEY